MTYELKDWLNSINFNKQDLIREDKTLIKEYPPYIINRCLSAFVECILFANEMNINHHLDKDMQYSFLLNTIRKGKRYSPWIKKDKIKDLECVKRYYGYSNEKASQVLKILNRSQLDFIKQKLETGGVK